MMNKLVFYIKSIRNLSVLFPIVTFFLGFYVCFLYDHKKNVNGVSFAGELNKRTDFVPRYYPVDAAGGGIWCSPIKTRLSGSAVLLVHVSPDTQKKHVLVVIQKLYRQGQPNYFASVPMGFYDPEHGNEQYNAFEVMEAESLIYESNLKGNPILVSDAYKLVREGSQQGKNEKAVSYKPDDDLMETAIRETREESGLDMSHYVKNGQIKEWKLIGVNETPNIIKISYYVEIHSTNLPDLKPQDNEITMAAWVPLEAISLSNKSVFVSGVSYVMRKDIPASLLGYLSFLKAKKD